MKKIMMILILLANCFVMNVVFAEDEYNFGDVIKYKDNNYYVIKEEEEYLMLLKETPFTIQELYQYGKDENGELFINKNTPVLSDLEKRIKEYNNGIGGISFYNSDSCKYGYKIEGTYCSRDNVVDVGCLNDYKSSDVKKVIDNWLESFKDDLMPINGEYGYLLSLSDLVEYFGFYGAVGTSGPDMVYKSDNAPLWLSLANSYWILSDLDEDDKKLYIVPAPLRLLEPDTTIDTEDSDAEVDSDVEVDSENSSEKVELKIDDTMRQYAVRPVIYLRKCALTDSCTKVNTKITKKTITVYKKFQVSDVVEYNGVEYYVLNDSSSKQKYVTLLKKIPLKNNEIEGFGSEDSYLNVPFYYSDTCYDDNNHYECTNEYNVSNAKKIVDEWANKKFKVNELVEVDGYKARLVTIEDASLYVLYTITGGLDAKIEGIKSWIFSNDFSYWTMSIPEEYTDYIITLSTLGNILGEGLDIEKTIVYKNAAIRPVINLNKCVLENGCWEEEVDIETIGDDTVEEIEVESTGKSITIISFVLCIILVVSGMFLIFYNYFKIQKSRE